MNTKKVSQDRRSFIKNVGSASLATLLVTQSQGGTTVVQAAEHTPAVRQTFYTYATETSWGPITAWHPAGDLRFTIDSGTGSAPASLSGQDQQGNSFAISFASNTSIFFGYFQHVNEGPIAYRGKLK